MMTTTGSSTQSSQNQEHEPLTQTHRLPIHAPVGSHGDVLLDLQVKYANDGNVRRRLVQDSGANKPSKKSDKQRMQAAAETLSEAAHLACASDTGDPEQAKLALENLAKTGSDDKVLFSVAGAYAQLALKRLESSISPAEYVRSHAKLERRLKQRTRNFVFGMALVVLNVLAILHQTGDWEAYIVLPLALFFSVRGYRTMKKKEVETKHVVEELYLIASSSSRQPV